MMQILPGRMQAGFCRITGIVDLCQAGALVEGCQARQQHHVKAVTVKPASSGRLEEEEADTADRLFHYLAPMPGEAVRPGISPAISHFDWPNGSD